MADAIVAFQGWDASGVGWGEDPWGESLASLPTGTGTVGTVVVACDVSVSVTGLLATAFLGAVVAEASADVNVTGVSATGQLGTISVTGEANINVAGLQATGSVGTVTVSLVTEIFVTGVSAQGQTGNVFIWSAIDDNQTPNWQNVISGNTVTWVQVLT